MKFFQQKFYKTVAKCIEALEHIESMQWNNVLSS